ncbi:MAG TPA: hypothetical protein VKI44_12400 [Acetobacteraceae bacterium]|nr:hypothetical protein [Acetobacteraceae bacterium]
MWVLFEAVLAGANRAMNRASNPPDAFFRRVLYDIGYAMDTPTRKPSDEHGAILPALIAELASVRVTRSVEADGYTLPEDTRGTVVAVYDRGAAYAVEIADLPGGPEVVTLRADQIEPAH